MLDDISSDGGLINVSPDGRLIQLIREILTERRTEPSFSIDDNLRLDIGLTSLDMTNLVLAIESSFRLEIPESKITTANFRSVRTISALIAELLPSRELFDHGKPALVER
jgi:acyl carrier protein